MRPRTMNTITECSQAQGLRKPSQSAPEQSSTAALPLSGWCSHRYLVQNEMQYQPQSECTSPPSTSTAHGGAYALVTSRRSAEPVAGYERSLSLVPSVIHAQVCASIRAIANGGQGSVEKCQAVIWSKGQTPQAALMVPLPLGWPDDNRRAIQESESQSLIGLSPTDCQRR